MGNTAIVIIDTDSLGEIERDPNFGSRLGTLINSFGHHFDIGGGARVISLAHTTEIQIVAVRDRFGAYVNPALKNKEIGRVQEFLVAEREKRNG